VFDGRKKTAYLETDDPNPQSMYGLSKWLGEELVLKTLSKSYIVRTSWLYGHGSKNFVNTMVKFASSQKAIKVVSDQIGSPTYVNDLADTLLQMIEKPFGTYHVSNNGQCSWYQFAKAIYEEMGTDSDLVQPITTKEYGAPAQRPALSLLNLSKLDANDISIPRHWREALSEFLVKEGLCVSRSKSEENNKAL
jgi:dTDP-4-dehydrorhamnose reductase